MVKCFLCVLQDLTTEQQRSDMLTCSPPPQVNGSRLPCLSHEIEMLNRRECPYTLQREVTSGFWRLEGKLHVLIPVFWPSSRCSPKCLLSTTSDLQMVHLVASRLSAYRFLLGHGLNACCVPRLAHGLLLSISCFTFPTTILVPGSHPVISPRDKLYTPPFLPRRHF